MHHDPGALFDDAVRRLDRRRHVAWLRERFGGVDGQWRCRQLFAVMPVRGAGPGYWDPLPWRGAKDSDFRLVMAVRCGAPPVPDDGFSRYPCPVEVDPVSGLATPAMEPRLLGARALWGPDIIDLLVVDQALEKQPRRLTGLAPALGGALDPDHWSDRTEQPVLVVRNVARWLARALDGACLPLGPAEEQAHFLRGLRGGVVTETTEHGKQLQALMRREAAPLPELYVEAA